MQLTFADRVTRIYYPIAIVLGTVDLAIAYLTLTPIAIEYPLKCTILMVYTTVLTVCVVLSASLFIYGGVNERPKQFVSLLLHRIPLGFYLHRLRSLECCKTISNSDAEIFLEQLDSASWVRSLLRF